MTNELMKQSTSQLTAPQIGYCTNVHAGTDLATIRQRLDEVAVPVAQTLGANERLGIGLWLPNSAALELNSLDKIKSLRDWFAERSFNAFTINGFPYDNFHLPVVKHRVYLPTWADDTRLAYTIRLAKILAGLHRDSDNSLATISTLPIGWPSANDDEAIKQSGARLRKLAMILGEIETETGVRVVIGIEPEPGCVIDRWQDMTQFFETELPQPLHRKYIGVCHDVCHSAVMFEDQTKVLFGYAGAGIMVAKVQVSSAIDLPLATMQSDERDEAVAQLRSFAEDRYLHQTGCIDATGTFRLVEDLPQWLSSDGVNQDAHVRVHFHVPIFLKSFGQLRSTQGAIGQCVQTLLQTDAPEFTGHWEVETYAWTVMPPEMRASGLAADIARELEWFKTALGVRTA